ncbi:MAG: hypothetical protein AB8B74_05530 [Crocinitomicaceae bacterium]
MTRYYFICLLFSLSSFHLKGSDRILDQVISVQLSDTEIKTILKKIETVGKVKFSYNPNLINDQKKVSLTLSRKTIRYGLNLIFENRVRLKEAGAHIVILKKEISPTVPSNAPKYRKVSGIVKDKTTNLPIYRASIYDIDSKYSVLTNDKGYFEFQISTTFDEISIYYAKTGYRTNVQIISLNDEVNINGSLALYAQTDNIEKLPTASVPKKVWTEIEDKTISGELFSMDVSTHSENLRAINGNRWGQISLVPKLTLNAGKNYQGILYNHFSLNILGGYSKGLKGLELGGIANVLKENALGLQAAGIINLVGGTFKGIQAAGISNVVKKDFYGLQTSTISNIVRQSFHGIQAAAIINTVRENFWGLQASVIGNSVNGKLTGIQIAGLINTVEKNMSGIQISGFSSMAKSGFYGLQFSGLINHASKTSYGMQISAIQNVALKKFVGAQITGFMNSAIEGANLFQMSGLLNIANKNNGLQLVGIVNYANQNNGLQIGLVNLSKVNKGLSLGLINIVWNGYHKIEAFTNESFIANIRIKSGVKRFYNIYSIGRQFDGVKNLTSLGFGFGAIYNLSESIAISTDIEGIVAFNSKKEFTQLAKFSPSFDYKISEHFTLFAGPTFNANYSVSEFNDIRIDEYSVYDETTGDDYLNFWIGGQFGLRF